MHNGKNSTILYAFERRDIIHRRIRCKTLKEILQYKNYRLEINTRRILIYFNFTPNRLPIIWYSSSCLFFLFNRIRSTL